MLTLHIPEWEDFNESSSRFVRHRAITINLEHSLLSISKWESKWHKPFLGKEKKTDEQTIDYIRCMVVGQDLDSSFVNHLTFEQITEIKQYIENPMTATWFSDENRPSREIVTSELIYYWMVAQQIPFECQKWHLNRLLTLIKICSIKNQPPKKMSTKALADRNKALNAARKKSLNTTG